MKAAKWNWHVMMCTVRMCVTLGALTLLSRPHSDLMLYRPINAGGMGGCVCLVCGSYNDDSVHTHATETFTTCAIDGLLVAI